MEWIEKASRRRWHFTWDLYHQRDSHVKLWMKSVPVNWHHHRRSTSLELLLEIARVINSFEKFLYQIKLQKHRISHSWKPRWRKCYTWQCISLWCFGGKKKKRSLLFNVFISGIKMPNIILAILKEVLSASMKCYQFHLH